MTSIFDRFENKSWVLGKWNGCEVRMSAKNWRVDTIGWPHALMITDYFSSTTPFLRASYRIAVGAFALYYTSIWFLRTRLSLFQQVFLANFPKSHRANPEKRNLGQIKFSFSQSPALTNTLTETSACSFTPTKVNSQSAIISHFKTWCLQGSSS